MSEQTIESMLESGADPAYIATKLGVRFAVVVATRKRMASEKEVRLRRVIAANQKVQSLANLAPEAIEKTSREERFRMAMDMLTSGHKKPKARLTKRRTEK